MVAGILRAWAALTLVILSGCYAHNFPVANSFTTSSAQSPLPPNVAQVFVDANGTFYPDDWRQFGLPRRPWDANSLLNDAADDPEMRAHIDREEARQLAELSAFAESRQRIFILVHGYNNRVTEALASYDAIEARLPFGQGDGVIRFYWDGLTGSGLGAGKIWFNATGYSQLAGSRGLRRILNRMSGKEIYLISHSRGASVILSALSNPVYDASFLEDTQAVASSWGSEFSNFLRPDALRDGNNRIHIMALAPAVDRIDFCDSSQQPPDNVAFVCQQFRPLGNQVRSFRYTVNALDPTLDKFIGLSGRFNPTGLGLRREVGERLRTETYPILEAYEFEPAVRSHRFRMYVASPAFSRMLVNAGLAPNAAP